MTDLPALSPAELALAERGEKLAAMLAWLRRHPEHRGHGEAWAYSQARQAAKGATYPGRWA